MRKILGSGSAADAGKALRECPRAFGARKILAFWTSKNPQILMIFLKDSSHSVHSEFLLNLRIRSLKLEWNPGAGRWRRRCNLRRVPTTEQAGVVPGPYFGHLILFFEHILKAETSFRAHFFAKTRIKDPGHSVHSTTFLFSKKRMLAWG